ncbi:hypothetical protein ES703_60661 [subsurface metagenome]
MGLRGQEPFIIEVVLDGLAFGVSERPAVDQYLAYVPVPAKVTGKIDAADPPF